jgi:hypothetical protein
MASPNIVGISTLIGFTTTKNMDSASEVNLLSNASGSNKNYKVNMLTVCNDGASTGYYTASFNTAAAGGGDNIAIIKNVGIATGSSLVIIDKASSLYLEENTSITMQASNANLFDVILSYESIES